MLVQKHVECHRAKKHCKLQGGSVDTHTPPRGQGQGPNYVGPSVGLCTLAYLAGNVGPAWSYVDPAWGYVGLS